MTRELVWALVAVLWLWALPSAGQQPYPADGVQAGASKGAEAVPEEKIQVAVMEFICKGCGFEQDKMDSLSDAAANLIREAGENLIVVGKDDIRSALSFEQQRQLLGCDNESCMAELGGALGVRWLVVGNLSLFGKSYLMNIKLIDVEKVRVAKGVTRSIPGQEHLLLEELPRAMRELLQSIDGARIKSLGALGYQQQGGVSDDLQHYIQPGSRVGLIPLSLSMGITAVLPPYMTKGDGIQLQGVDQLDKLILGFRVQAYLGYTLLDWLSAGPRLRVGFGSDPDRDRLRTWFDGALEIRGTLPLNYWLRPVAIVSVGVGKMWDHPNGDGPEIDSLFVSVEMDLLLEMLLSESWRLGLLVGACEDIYASIHADDRREDSKGFALGLSIQLNVGYEF
ncbi:MAG: hypothetical protein JXR96_07490 [Deltaproteobacteria bacterium]|nr:hypothetical protein [Deltaproteobacteria bacterium]